MQRISSNATLFLKIFIPTFWTVFFGAFTIAIWTVGDVPYFGPIPAIWMKLGLTAFLSLGVTFFYLTFLQLKRVELDELYVYASNYYTTYRYPYHNVEKITERDMALFHLVRIYLKVPGKFGKKLTFLLDETMFKDFLEKFPDVAITMAELKLKAKD
ncbi:MAG: hypothetical protein GC192_23255 [Bacteroidetes bacterium]|nr:hypothetical protein [Bacteroidota bacterium]